MLKYLLEKEFKQIIRNRFLSKILVMMPLMIIVLFPYVTSQEVKNVAVAVVDSDHSQQSARLVQKVGATAAFRLAGFEPDYKSALRLVEKGDADIILTIPRGFGRDMVRGVVPQVMVSANSVDGMRGALGAQYLTAVVTDFASETEASEGRPVATAAAGHISYRFNPTLDYKVYMVPGLIAVLLTLLCCAITALNITGEKETGTIEQINVTPVSKRLFILAKLMPNWVIGFIALAFGMTFAWAVHGIAPAGGLATVVVFAALHILVTSAMGMIISNYSDTMQQSMFVIFFFIILMMLTCGLFTPIGSMPEWTQKLTTVNPMTYFNHAMRMTYLKGSSVAELLTDLLWMCGFAVVLNLWAVASYRKSS